MRQREPQEPDRRRCPPPPSPASPPIACCPTVRAIPCAVVHPLPTSPHLDAPRHHREPSRRPPPSRWKRRRLGAHRGARHGAARPLSSSAACRAVMNSPAPRCHGPLSMPYAAARSAFVRPIHRLGQQPHIRRHIPHDVDGLQHREPDPHGEQPNTTRNIETMISIASGPAEPPAPHQPPHQGLEQTTPAAAPAGSAPSSQPVAPGTPVQHHQHDQDVRIGWVFHSRSVCQSVSPVCRSRPLLRPCNGDPKNPDYSSFLPHPLGAPDGSPGLSSPSFSLRFSLFHSRPLPEPRA